MAIRSEPVRSGLRPGARALPGRGVALVAAGLAVALALAAGLALARGGGAAPAREVLVTARDVRFDGDNPTLELHAGERVALTLVNREAAVPHDFVVAGLGVRTSGYVQPGGAQTVVFTPTRPGTYRYACTLHPGLMDGQVVVR